MSFYPAVHEFDVWEWADARVAELWGGGDNTAEDVLAEVERLAAGIPDIVTLDFVLASRELRRELCRDDPLLFAWVYLRKHLTDPNTGDISFAQPHLEWCELARGWMDGSDGIAEWRHAFIAPRETGKTTWWFLCIPMWALAYGHASFVAAFANQTGQAEQHLATFKRELDINPDLRADFLDLCTPARRPSGTQVADRQGMLHCRNGAVFAAKGVDAASLGMKVEQRRPDVLIMDDLEPDEANYSQRLAEKRLSTVRDAILPLNIRARVILVGTVTMPESITHQLVRTAQGLREPELEWVYEDNIVCHHQLPLICLDDGREVSAWPQKWPTEWLLERRHTREYAKNYANDPMARDGEYWTVDDFRYRDDVPLTHAMISIDPAVTDKNTSDYTAIAVIGYSAVEKVCVVRHAQAVKVQPGEPLRRIILRLCEQYPDVAGLVIESNQGGAMWRTVLHHLPVPMKLVHQKAPKEVRAADLLAAYQRGRVFHESRMPALEGQMVSFPKGANDDLVDAVGTGCAIFLKPRKTAGTRSLAYV